MVNGERLRIEQIRKFVGLRRIFFSFSPSVAEDLTPAQVNGLRLCKIA
jgi:hypothetical protein